MEEDYLLNEETGKFELLPPVDPGNEYYVQYFLFDGSNLCPSGGINKSGGKKYSCDDIGWLKYELKENVLTLRKDLAYPGSDTEKWGLKLSKNKLEVLIVNEVTMRRVVKKMTSSKDFTKASEIKSVPVPKFR